MAWCDQPEGPPDAPDCTAGCFPRGVRHGEFIPGARRGRIGSLCTRCGWLRVPAAAEVWEFALAWSDEHDGEVLETEEAHFLTAQRFDLYVALIQRFRDTKLTPATAAAIADFLERRIAAQRALMKSVGLGFVL
jgi:hypothetical protein